MTAVLTVSIWHNVTRDPQGRHAGFGGFTPGDQMVKVFTYELPPGGSRDPTAIAENAFAIGNGAPGLDSRAASLAARYAAANAPVSLGRRHGRRRRDRPHRCLRRVRAPARHLHPRPRPRARHPPHRVTPPRLPRPEPRRAAGNLPPGGSIMSSRNKARRHRTVPPHPLQRAACSPRAAAPPRRRPPAGSPSRMRRLPRGTCPSCAASWRSGWPGRAPGST